MNVVTIGLDIPPYSWVTSFCISAENRECMHWSFSLRISWTWSWFFVLSKMMCVREDFFVLVFSMRVQHVRFPLHSLLISHAFTPLIVYVATLSKNRLRLSCMWFIFPLRMRFRFCLPHLFTLTYSVSYATYFLIHHVCCMIYVGHWNAIDYHCLIDFYELDIGLGMACWV